MDDIPLSTQFSILGLLLFLSGLFSMSETAMMAANRYRLRHQAAQGVRGARLALNLLAQTDQLLGVILLGNNLINSAAAMLVSVITIELFGDDKWALGAGTLAITFAILVFSEISPKVVGATHADRLAMLLAYVLTPMLRLCHPLIWFINLFVAALLGIFGLKLRPDAEQSSRLSPEELRTLVLESSRFIPQKNHAILLNLFDLGQVTVEDVMTPRAHIEGLDLDAPWEEIVTRMTTSYHTRLPVYHNDPGRISGVLHLRRVLPLLSRNELSLEMLLPLVQPPYFIPGGTPVLPQLQFFQENRQRIALVVDEYGEVQGLVTLEDIMEEIVGEFTTSLPTMSAAIDWDADGSLLVEGGRSLRELNRKLRLDFPLDGPKTLNGLIVEYFRDIPEAGVSIKIGRIPIEIVQTQDRSVKTARIFRPPA